MHVLQRTIYFGVFPAARGRDPAAPSIISFGHYTVPFGKREGQSESNSLAGSRSASTSKTTNIRH
jgi:hypothetical protein